MQKNPSQQLSRKSCFCGSFKTLGFIPQNLLIAKLAAYDFEEIDALRHICSYLKIVDNASAKTKFIVVSNILCLGLL